MTHLTKLLCSLIYASAFVVVGMITNWSVQQTRMYEAMSVVAQAKYEAQRTADMVSLMKNSKPDMGCPVEEVRIPQKRGKSKQVCSS